MATKDKFSNFYAQLVLADNSSSAKRNYSLEWLLRLSKTKPCNAPDKQTWNQPPWTSLLARNMLRCTTLSSATDPTPKMCYFFSHPNSTVLRQDCCNSITADTSNSRNSCFLRIYDFVELFLDCEDLVWINHRIVFVQSNIKMDVWV